MKKISVLLVLMCLLFAGCAGVSETVTDSPVPTDNTVSETPNNEISDAVQRENAKTIYPLPNTTAGNIADAILSVSLEEGDVYVDSNGIMKMDVKIYSYDMYDMVDISMLEFGDTLVTHAGEVKVDYLERGDNGVISINGGLGANGFDLITDDCGVYYERGYNDVKNWYEVAEASIIVSGEFVYRDASDLDKGETLYYPGNFLADEVTDYYFTPRNTTIRIENNQIVEMNRVYIP